MKHSDALTLICPFATKQHVPQSKPAALVGKPPETFFGVLHTNCVGDKCMSWQKAGDKEFAGDGACSLIEALK